MKLKGTCSLGEKLWPTNLDSIIKKQRHYFANKDLFSQSYGFSGSHVWMWELDHKAERQRIDAFNCAVGENSWESLGQEGGQTSPS